MLGMMVRRPKPGAQSAGVFSESSPSAVRGHVLPGAPGTDESPALRRSVYPWPPIPAFCPPPSGAPPGTALPLLTRTPHLVPIDHRSLAQRQDTPSCPRTHAHAWSPWGCRGPAPPPAPRLPCVCALPGRAAIF